MVTKGELVTTYSAYDIDYYLLINGKKIAHFASAGGPIPQVIIDNYSEMLLFDDYIKKMSAWTEAIPMSDIDTVVKFSSKQEKDNYLKNFLTFSERGLLSFDRSDLTDVSALTYHLVSMPSIYLKIEQLPKEFQTILFKLKIDDPLNVPKSINLKSR